MLYNYPTESYNNEMAFYVLIGFLYIIVGCNSAYSIEVEPKCSKYDFEEKLLEKMIRLEHSTGIMMERFNDLSVKVENDLSTMKQEFNEIKLQVKEDQEHYKKIAEGKSVLVVLYAYVIKKHKKMQRSVKYVFMLPDLPFTAVSDTNSIKCSKLQWLEHLWNHRNISRN